MDHEKRAEVLSLFSEISEGCAANDAAQQDRRRLCFIETTITGATIIVCGQCADGALASLIELFGGLAK